jgi:hypothetical protein
MKNITIILPIHKLDENYKVMLENAITSVYDFHNDVELMIVCNKKIKTEILKLNLTNKLELLFVENNTKNDDFCSQINLGIDNCKTEWFSIFEIDDIYQPLWLKSMTDYVKENPFVDVFLPIVNDIDSNGDFIGFMNESVWSYGFTEQQGFLNNETLFDYQNFQTSGGLYRTKKIIDSGKFKENIKLTFTYEFLLRLTHLGLNIMVVPKVGYQHVNLREDSIFYNFLNDEKLKIEPEESLFWLETAKKECFFKNKRDVKYIKTVDV